MSNLGWYQKIVQMAKFVGGPKRLMALLAMGGYVVIKPIELASKKAVRLIKRHSKQEENSIATYRVIKDSVVDERISLRVDDIINVLVVDNDAVLIEIQGDENNPYIISLEQLIDVTNYNDHSSDENIRDSTENLHSRLGQ